MDEGCRKEDAEYDNWEWEPEQEPSCEKRWIWNNWTWIRDNNIECFYQIFTTVCWWLSLIPGSVFRLKKEDSEENSEDVSEGDPEENIAGEQAWHGTKRKVSIKSTQLIETSVRYVSRIAISIVSIVFSACYVFQSYSVDPFCLFSWGRRGPRKGSWTRIIKSSIRPHQREKGM